MPLCASIIESRPTCGPSHEQVNLIDFEKRSINRTPAPALFSSRVRSIRHPQGDAIFEAALAAFRLQHTNASNSRRFPETHHPKAGISAVRAANRLKFRSSKLLPRLRCAAMLLGSCGSRWSGTDALFVMSQHRSLRAAAATGGRRNVLKRFERVAILKAAGNWKDGDRVTGLRKTRPPE
jgi:small basic protein (TIGR04137 family)